MIYNGGVNLILAKRQELGLTQAQVARMLGTKQSNISSYERGVLAPGSVIEQRFAGLLALTLDSRYRSFEVGTFASSGVFLRDFLLSSGVHPSGINKPNGETDRMLWETDVIRFMIELRDQFTHLDNSQDQTFFMSEPATTGNADIDALYAGMAVHLTRTSLLERVPRWTNKRLRTNSPAWFPGLPDQHSILHRHAIANGIPSLRARGIFIDRKNLESI